jgi:(p)ppGpp synthase/HD superfamily hydrolase
MTNHYWSQENYIKAFKFAANAHRGQTVPGTDLPYITHLSFVSMEVLAALTVEKGHDENLAVQCALLHDVIEDTAITYSQIAKEFGSQIADGVLALSKNKSLDKSSQMADSLTRIKLQPSEIWMVKLADRITNLQPPPVAWTKDKIQKYQVEATEILDALRQASAFLSSRLDEKIHKYSLYI